MRLTLFIPSALMLLTQTFFTKVNDFSDLTSPVKSRVVYNNVSLTKTVYHKFSSKTKLDKFQISLKGKTILSGKVTFTIFNALGKSIYKDSFDAKYLIDYGFDDDNPSVEKQELYIKKRLSTFFDKDKFEKPAIKKFDKFDKDYSEDKNVWEEIKADQSSVGFTYLIGEENSRSIAWSQKQQKVIVYFSCC